MSSEWNSKKALVALETHLGSEIADLLLDQNHFAGVGNIIKNEVLYLVKKLPTAAIATLSTRTLKKIIKTTQDFSHQFYTWRKAFELKPHYQIYRKSICPKCQGKVSRKRTGQRARISFFCPHCQK